MSDIEKGIELELKQFKGHYINLVKCEKRYLDLGLGFNKNYRKL